MRKSDFNKTVFADWLPDPFTVATHITKLLTDDKSILFSWGIVHLRVAYP
jgi:hypothetical protein